VAYGIVASHGRAHLVEIKLIGMETDKESIPPEGKRISVGLSDGIERGIPLSRIMVRSSPTWPSSHQ